MKNRCTNPNSGVYRHYGARGITVCERWLDSFENFLADMGTRPASRTPGSRAGAYSLGRIDNELGYSPTNCRWETTEQQNNNTRSTARGRPKRPVIIRGETYTLDEALTTFGITRRTFYRRLASGMSDEAALTEPLQK